MRVRTVLALAIVLGGCASSEPLMVPPQPCGGPLEVTVAGSATPEISWLPHCGITDLTVRHESATVEPDPWVWSFSAPERAPVGPKIIYGKAPERATVYVAPKALTPGEIYRVTVEYRVGGDVVSASGTTSFTWWPPD